MAETIRLRLPKKDSLTNVKLIESVFKSNFSVKAFPLIFSYNIFTNPAEPGVQVMFSVSKRKFKRAVDRNRIKRLMRESFRLNKVQFTEALNGKAIYGSFIFTNKEVPDFEQLSKSMNKIILKLNENLRD